MIYNHLNTIMATLDAKYLARCAREQKQRDCAVKRLKIQWQSLPKREREQLRSKARDLKYDFIQQQSGVSLAGAATMAAASAVAGAAAGYAAGVGTTSKINHMCDAVSDVLGRVSDAAAGTTTMVGGVNGFFATLHSAIVSAVDACKSVIGGLWKVLFGTFVFAVASALGCTTFVLRMLQSLVTPIVPEFDGLIDSATSGVAQPQGCFDIVPHLVTMVCTVMVPNSNKFNMIGEVMRRVANFDRTAAGFESVFAAIAKFVQDAINVIMRLLGREELTLVGAAQKMVIDWCKEVDALCKIIDTSVPTISDLTRANALMTSGYNLKNITQAQHLRSTIEKQLDKLNGKIAAHRGILDVDNAFRQQPVFALFGGSSAVGKTTLIKTIASSVLVLSGLCKANECAQQMWQKGDTEYWNGYCGQLVYVMDDVFQKKAVKGAQDNEGLTIIKAVGNWPFPLNFADVESKGRWYFSSKLMIGTTNVADVKTAMGEVLAQPEAVVRRIDHGYWVRVNPEWVNVETGGLDYYKLEAAIKERRAAVEANPDATQRDWVMAFPWEAWTLVPHDFRKGVDTGSPAGEGRSVDGLVYELANQLVERKDRHELQVGDLLGWLSGMEKARPQAGVELASGSMFDVDRPLSDWPNLNAIEPGLGLVDLADAPIDEDINVLLDSYDRLELPDINEEDGITKVLPRRVPMRYDNVSVPERAPKEFEAYNSDFKRYDSVFLKKNWVRVSIGEPVPLRPVTDWKEQAYEAVWANLDWRARAVARIKGFFHGLPVLAQNLILGFKAIAFQAGAFCLAYAAGVAICKLLAFAINAVSGLLEACFKAVWGQDEAEQQSVHVSNPVHPSKRKASVPSDVVLQMGNPPEDNISDIVYANTYKVMAGDEPLGQILMLRGQIAMMPHHYRRLADKGVDLTFISCAMHENRFVVPAKDFLAWPSESLPACDLCFVDMSKGVARAHRDVVKFFVSNKDFLQISKGNNTHVRLNVAQQFVDGDRVKLHKMIMSTKYLRYDPVLGTSAGDIQQVWAYDMPTKLGHCGAPLTISEPRFYSGRAILGIHIAGKTQSAFVYGSREGYSAVTTRELIDAVLKRFKPIQDNFSEDMVSRGINVGAPDEDAIFQAGITGGSIAPIGVVGREHALSQSTFSKLKRTGFSGFGPCPVRPAFLRPVVVEGELVKPMIQAMKLYKSPLRHYSLPKGDAIMALAMKRHWEITANHSRQLLTKDEAVVGVPGMKIKAINRSTSPGYPWRLLHSDGKKDFFGSGDEFDMSGHDCQLLYSRVDHIIDSAKQGVRLSHIFTDFLKDETRPHAKVDAVATRAISGAPLDYSVAVRMYFGAFLAAMFSTHTVSGMSPGINHYSEWSVLAQELLKAGDKVFGGDFKAFDASEQPQIHKLILKYINDWYARGGGSQEDALVREVLFEDLVHSRHLTGESHTLDTIVQWNKSLPSGHPLTTPVNSMYSLFTLTACYCHLTGDYENMWDHAFIATFGDDNVNSVSDTVSEVFNQVTVAAAMEKLFGLTYTSDKKDAELVPYESIFDVTFLKRSFRRDAVDGGWVAPLAMDSILYRTYYFRNPRNFAGEMEQNMKEALMELSLHDKKEWPERYAAAEEYCRRESIPFTIISYEQAQQMCFARTDVWF